jgi:hypothetical protein
MSNGVVRTSTGCTPIASGRGRGRQSLEMRCSTHCPMHRWVNWSIPSYVCSCTGYFGIGNTPSVRIFSKTRVSTDVHSSNHGPRQSLPGFQMISGQVACARPTIRQAMYGTRLKRRMPILNIAIPA